MNKVPHIFIAYARKDKSSMQKLKTHLNVLQRRKVCHIFFDGEIAPGENWDDRLKKELHQADIFVLLISEEFLDSDYVNDVELPNVMAQEKAGTARIVPVILRHCLWKHTDLRSLQVIRKDGKAIEETNGYGHAAEVIASIVQQQQESINQQIATVEREKREMLERQEAQKFNEEDYIKRREGIKRQKQILEDENIPHHKEIAGAQAERQRQLLEEETKKKKENRHQQTAATERKQQEALERKHRQTAVWKARQKKIAAGINSFRVWISLIGLALLLFFANRGCQGAIDLPKGTILCAENGGDADGDGICADKDCNDNDVKVTASQDTDGDGICDDLDECPEDTGPLNNNGCPPKDPPVIPINLCDSRGGDADGDGICADKDCDDKNPKKLASTDSDGDGICANKDCNDSNALKNASLDSDNDGVCDDIDKCKYEKGPVNNKGCPIPNAPCKNDGGDADGDGLCANNDCNDSDASSLASTDMDGDGICADKDCNDNDADRNASIDFDEDGICANLDCNDNDASKNASIDSDGDGICDDIDKCKGEKGSPENSGCPPCKDEGGDADKDGICSINDCNDANADEEASNDSDGDGFCDDVDKCKFEYAPDSEEGCLPKFASLPTDRKSGLSNFKKVIGGTYKMGSPTSDKDHTENECLHDVTVNDFFISQYEVTQKDWLEVMTKLPERQGSTCDQCPVVWVSWFDVKEFIIKANEKYGTKFRLPWEREWEYAARGGNNFNDFIYAGSNNIDKVARYKDKFRSGSNAHKVGGKNPNALGLYDMSGNVMEWCEDKWGPYFKNCKTSHCEACRVVRGGSYANSARSCRVANRESFISNNRGPNLGLRLVHD